MSDQDRAIISRAAVVITFWTASLALAAGIGVVLGVMVRVCQP